MQIGWVLLNETHPMTGHLHHISQEVNGTI
jgi:hypothetical protein